MTLNWIILRHVLNLVLRVDNRVLHVEVAEVGQQIVHGLANRADDQIAVGGQRVRHARQVANQKDAERHEKVHDGRGERAEENRQRGKHHHLKERHQDALYHFARQPSFLQTNGEQEHNAHCRDIEEHDGENHLRICPARTHTAAPVWKAPCRSCGVLSRPVSDKCRSQSC